MSETTTTPAGRGRHALTASTDAHRTVSATLARMALEHPDRDPSQVSRAPEGPVRAAWWPLARLLAAAGVIGALLVWGVVAAMQAVNG